MSTETLLIIMPEVVLCTMAVVIYAACLWIGHGSLWRWLALAALVMGIFTWGISPQHVSHLAQREVMSDSLGEYFRLLILVSGFLLILCQWEPPAGRGKAEYMATLLLALAGAMLATSAKDLVLIFVGLEFLSVATYVLLCVGRDDRLGHEAVLKYFFLSVLSTVLLLYGFSFLYGLGGSTDLSVVTHRLATIWTGTTAVNYLAIVALVLIGAGLAFKSAAAPFHFYAPDVYSGTSYTNAALLSALPKVAGLAVFLRLTGQVFAVGLTPSWQLLAILAAASLAVGNLGALLQRHLRRLLAYSSIAHAGYMLMGIAAFAAAREAGTTSPFFSFDGAGAFALYILVYLLATLGIFAGLIALEREGREVVDIADLSGAAWSNQPAARLVAWSMVICLFSLAGVPPLAGFWGKLAIFGSALSIPPAHSDAFGVFVGLAIFAAINTAIGAAYYLRIIAALVFSPATQRISVRSAVGPPIAVVITAFFIIGIGLWWQPWWRWAQTASPRVTSTLWVNEETPTSGEAGFAHSDWRNNLPNAARNLVAQNP